MTVIHITESFASGVYDFISDLSRGMLDEQHVVVYAIRSNTPNDFPHDFQEKTRFIHWRHAVREISPKHDLLALLELIKILKKYDSLDVIHLHSSKAGFLGRIAAKCVGMSGKVIYTPHGVSFLRKDVSPLMHKVLVWLERVGSWFGGRTIACSKSEMEVFHQYNLPADYINNGIACKQTDMPPLDNDKFCIGTIGRITAQKNPHLFNQIAECFVDIPGIEFLWIGDGKLRDELNSPNIYVTGWLGREDVEKNLAKIDSYLSTSLWEGLPLSVLQAMCAKKPLVLSDCIGNRDLLRDDINGKMFITLDEGIAALLELHESSDLREQMGMHSLKIVEEYFTIDRMVQEYQRLYCDL